MRLQIEDYIWFWKNCVVQNEDKDSIKYVK